MAVSSMSRMALRRSMAQQPAASSWSFNAARTYATAGKNSVSKRTETYDIPAKHH